jgi:hypothetical protein
MARRRRHYVDSINLPDGIYHTVKFLADKYSITESQVHKMVAKLKIKHTRIGGIVLVVDDERFAASPPPANGGLFKQGEDDRRVKIFNYSELVVKVDRLADAVDTLTQKIAAMEPLERDSNQTLHDVLHHLTQVRTEAPRADNGQASGATA